MSITNPRFSVLRVSASPRLRVSPTTEHRPGSTPTNAVRRSLRRRGGAVVETALVLPIVLLFLFGIMEYGRYIFALQIFTNAAREGCRYAVTHTQPVTIGGVTTGNNTSDVNNTINAFLGGQQLTGQATQVYLSDSKGNNLGAWNNAQPGQFICVKITGNYTVMLPSLLSMPNTIPIAAESVMICEGN